MRHQEVQEVVDVLLCLVLGGKPCSTVIISQDELEFSTECFWRHGGDYDALESNKTTVFATILYHCENGSRAYFRITKFSISFDLKRRLTVFGRFLTMPSAILQMSSEASGKLHFSELDHHSHR